MGSVWSFAKLAVLSLGCAFMSVGLLYRREGGWGPSRQNGVGAAFSLYSFLVVVLESTLLEAGLYPVPLFLATSAVMTGLVFHLLAQRAIGNFYAVLSVACSIGKLAELLPAEYTAGTEFLSAFALISSSLLPTTFSKPFLVTEEQAKASRKKEKELPEEIRSLFQAWACGVLPLGFYFSLEYVVRPLVATLPAFGAGGGVAPAANVVSDTELFFFVLGR